MRSFSIATATPPAPKLAKQSGEQSASTFWTLPSSLPRQLGGFATKTTNVSPLLSSSSERLELRLQQQQQAEQDANQQRHCERKLSGAGDGSINGAGLANEATARRVQPTAAVAGETDERQTIPMVLAGSRAMPAAAPANEAAPLGQTADLMSAAVAKIVSQNDEGPSALSGGAQFAVAGEQGQQMAQARGGQDEHQHSATAAVSSSTSKSKEEWFKQMYKQMHASKPTAQRSILDAVNEQRQRQDRWSGEQLIKIKLKSPRTDHRFSPSYFSEEERISSGSSAAPAAAAAPAFDGHPPAASAQSATGGSLRRQPANISDYLPGQSSISQHERNLVSSRPASTAHSSQASSPKSNNSPLSNTLLASTFSHLLATQAPLSQAHRAHQPGVQLRLAARLWQWRRPRGHLALNEHPPRQLSRSAAPGTLASHATGLRP